MVKSATRVLKILTIIGSSKDGMKHIEISKALDIPKASLSFLLNDLITEGFLNTDISGKKYTIGPQILSLAGKYLSSLDIVKLSQPILSELVAKTNESAGLAVKIEHDIIIVCRENCTELFKWDWEIGTRLPMYSSASGKTFLAYFDEEELRGYLNKVSLIPQTKNTITNKRTLIKELKKVRREKIAYAMEEQYQGMIAIAAPIFNNEGRVAASILQPIPTIRFTSEKEQIIINEVKKASEHISRYLGFVTPT